MNMFEKLRGIFPHKADVFNNLAGHQAVLGSVEKAKVFFKQALLLDPDSPAAGNEASITPGCYSLVKTKRISSGTDSFVRIALALQLTIFSGVASQTDLFKRGVLPVRESRNLAIGRYEVLGFTQLDGTGLFFLLDRFTGEHMTQFASPANLHLKEPFETSGSAGPRVEVRIDERIAGHHAASVHRLQTTEIDGFFQNCDFEEVFAFLQRKLSKVWPDNCHYAFRGDAPKTEGLHLVFRGTPLITALEMLCLATGKSLVTMEENAVIFSDAPEIYELREYSLSYGRTWSN
jgi:hypothetical protein